MLPRRLWLIRHAEAEHNSAARRAWNSLQTSDIELPTVVLRCESKLTPRGRTQAEVIRKWFGGKLSDDPAYYMSDTIRARQTAQIIAPQATWRQSSLLSERSLGFLEDMPSPERRLRELNERSWRGISEFRYRPEKQYGHIGESFADVEERFARFMKKLEAGNIADDVVVVCHSSTIRVAWKFFCGIPEADFSDYYGSSQRVYTGSVVEYSQGYEKSGQQAPSFRWTRTCTPYRDFQASDWRPVQSSETRQLCCV